MWRFGCCCCFRWKGVPLFTKTRVITHNCFDVLMDLFRYSSMGNSIKLTIPPNSQHGKKFRLKGRGLPGTPDGDLYVTLSIVVPPAQTHAEKELYHA